MPLRIMLSEQAHPAGNFREIRLEEPKLAKGYAYNDHANWPQNSDENYIENVPQYILFQAQKQQDLPTKKPTKTTADSEGAEYQK